MARVARTRHDGLSVRHAGLHRPRDPVRFARIAPGRGAGQRQKERPCVTRHDVLCLLAALAAIAIPATAAQAKTKNVDMGIPTKSAKAFQDVGADVNAFFPARITIRAGDKVKFRPTGFHNVDLPPNGGKPLPLLSPAGTASGVNDANGAPFWFNGQPSLGFTPALVVSSFGKTFKRKPNKRIESGLPLGPNLKPMTVKFGKKGTYKYYCDVHPGMIGRVVVKGRHAKVPSAKKDKKAVKKQVAAALKVAKKLPTQAPPANTVYTGGSGKGGVEYFGMLPASKTVAAGTTLTFAMSPRTRDVHTATFGPGNPETEPTSYLGQIAATFEGAPVIDPRGTYPSEQPPAVASLSPALHGNGFWNSGALDRAALDAAAAVQHGEVRHAGDVRLLLPDPPVHARADQGPVRRRATFVALLGMGAAALAAAPAPAAVKHYWVAAVPVSWNVVPNQHDAIMGMMYPPSETVFPTVVYRRYSKNWKRPLNNQPQGDGNQDLMPGPLLRARVGDRLRIHFKNLDTTFKRPHSMHFHGVHYKPSSDGAYLPGFSGRDADVKPGRTFTYKLTAGRDSVGAWPYHDHGPRWRPRSTAACGACSRSAGAPSACPTASSSWSSRRWGSSRASTAAPSSATRRCSGPRSATSCSGTSWRWAPSTTPSTSTATAGARRACRATPRPSARPSRSASAGRSRTRARGCTTATSRPTWRRA